MVAIAVHILGHIIWLGVGSEWPRTEVEGDIQIIHILLVCFYGEPEVAFIEGSANSFFDVFKRPWRDI